MSINEKERRKKYRQRPEVKLRIKQARAEWYKKNKKRVYEYQVDWKKKNLERKRELQRKWKAKNRNKVIAERIFYKAFLSGQFKKEPCIVCGDENVHAHHPDYSQPLKIIWLCVLCHRQVHLKIQNREKLIKSNTPYGST